jgi:hypothetical protein
MPIMSFQRIFQSLVVRGAAVEAQHADRLRHPPKKIVPRCQRQNHAERFRSSSFSSDSRWCDRGLAMPAEAFGDKGSRLVTPGPLA